VYFTKHTFTASKKIMLVAPSYYTFTIPKNHDKGQADGDGQVFHTGSLGRIIWDGQENRSWVAVSYLTPNLFRYRSTAELGISLL
jgi:hypothetical protein